MSNTHKLPVSAHTFSRKRHSRAYLPSAIAHSQFFTMAFSILFAFVVYLFPTSLFNPVSSIAHSSSALMTNPPLTSRSFTCPVQIPDQPPSAPDLRRSISTTRQKLPRIINGDLASDALRPYLASLLVSIPPTGFGRCTGTLVSPNWVLTAAHCIASSFILVAVGANRSLGDQDQSFISAAFAEGHPAFLSDEDFRFDIGFIRLLQPAPADAKFMKINVNISIPAANTFVRSAGYGTTFSDPSAEPESVSGFLRQVDLPVTSERSCQSDYIESVVSYDAQVCAGYSQGGCSACFGDSGGPLIQYDAAGEPVLVGVTSFGKEICSAPNSPGVYVRPAFHEQWLDEQGVEYTKTTSTDPVIFESTESDELSLGAIIGIAVGGGIVIFSLTVTCCIALSFIRRRRRRKDAASSLAPDIVVSGETYGRDPSYLRMTAPSYQTAHTGLLPPPEEPWVPPPDTAQPTTIHARTALEPSPEQESHATPLPPQVVYAIPQYPQYPPLYPE